MTLWLRRSGTGQQAQHDVCIEIHPSPTIMAEGLGGGNRSQYWIEEDGMPQSAQQNTGAIKPPYRVPLMTEITALPWNGLTVASTFSGAGGSCTGYRMAGFKVIWANEFVPAAQDSYRANAADGSYLDSRDIKNVKPEEILEVTGLKVGELDLFDGSPPCQAFSTAGKREKGWGQDKTYEHGAQQKNETLFTEYIRLLRGLKPRTFVAENVSGLVKGTAKGFFLEILSELKLSGYRVNARLLDAQWLGVPQQRQRVIFIGVRDDIGKQPVHPKPLAFRYTVRDALQHVTKAVHDTGSWQRDHDFTNLPSPAIVASAASANHYKVIHEQGGFAKVDTTERPSPAVLATQCRINVETSTGKRKFTIDELKRICAFPDDFILHGSYAQQWERLGNSVPPVMMCAIATEIRDRILLKSEQVKA